MKDSVARIPKEILSIWIKYAEEDKFFFYNPLENLFILGVGKSVEEKKHAYRLFPFKFFLEENSLQGFVFDKYFIIQDGNILSDFTDSDYNQTFQTEKHELKPLNEDYSEWQKLFEHIKSAIRSGEVEKVVASRKVSFKSEKKISSLSILNNLVINDPKAFVFAYQFNGKVFLGASPEILVQKKNAEILTYALAGTIAKDGVNDVALGEALLADEKNAHEHNIVVESIRNSMQKYAAKVDVWQRELAEFPNLFHLKTIITAQNKKLSLVDWAKVLHPTPAMGGFPVAQAQEIIRKYENYDREFYAAPFGVMDSKGDGIFVVGIRSCLVDGTFLHAYAGCGIVEKSQCEEEFLETNSKLKTILKCV